MGSAASMAHRHQVGVAVGVITEFVYLILRGPK